MNLFSSKITEKQIFEEKVRKLKLAILALPKNVPLSREELHYDLMVQDKSWFGKIGRTHLTQALKELLQESPLRINSNGTPGKDETIFTWLFETWRDTRQIWGVKRATIKENPG